MAMASVISADETRLRESLIGESYGQCFRPEKTPPIPLFKVNESHAASTLHITVSGEGEGAWRDEILEWLCATSEGTALSEHCALCHSRASAMALEIICIPENTLFSKQSLFLPFHSCHRIQGHKGMVRPTGGRITKDWAEAINIAIEGAAELGLLSNGASSHTCSATLKCKNTCKSSSTQLQLLQGKAGMPRVARFELTGIALRTIFHRKSFNLWGCFDIPDALSPIKRRWRCTCFKVGAHY